MFYGNRPLHSPSLPTPTSLVLCKYKVHNTQRTVHTIQSTTVNSTQYGRSELNYTVYNMYNTLFIANY